jgi:hypothetical protein
MAIRSSARRWRFCQNYLTVLKKSQLDHSLAIKLLSPLQEELPTLLFFQAFGWLEQSIFMGLCRESNLCQFSVYNDNMGDVLQAFMRISAK